MSYQTQILKVNNSESIPATIRLIGQSIQSAASYLPLLLHARNLASLAPPHDYMGQLEAVYNDTISNWRYVRDPANMEAVTVSPPEIMEFTLGFNADGTRSMGTGDCDDITIALGALLNAIGFETRIVTSTDPARPKNWSHVFIQALVPEVGWVTVDPVLYPDLPFASTVETTRLGYWDLNGAYQYAENLAGCMAGCNTSLAGQRKYSYDGQIYEGEEILPFESIHSLGGEFGCEIERLGYIGNANCWNIELMPEDYISATEAITPVIAVSPQDFEYLSVVGFPYEGMKAVGNTGYIYEFTKNRDGLHGPVIDFFKGIGRAIKKGFNKVVSFVKGAVSWAWDKVENVFEATKVGRWILNVKDRVLDFAVQVITPLAEFVGKWAPAAASIAAVVPGVGTLVSMGILATGAAAKAYVKWGVPIVNTIIEIDGEEVEVPVPEFVDDEQEAAVLAELELDIAELEAMDEEDLQIMVEEWAATTEIPESGNYFEPDTSILNEIADDLRLQEAERNREAFQAAFAAAEANREAQAYAAEQAAAAKHYYIYERPEVIEAQERAQAAAYANQQQVIEASQAAAAMAEAARASAQNAIERQFEALAINDPQYQADKLAEVALNLQAIGYDIEIT